MVMSVKQKNHPQQQKKAKNYLRKKLTTTYMYLATTGYMDMFWYLVYIKTGLFCSRLAFDQETNSNAVGLHCTCTQSYTKFLLSN